MALVANNSAPKSPLYPIENLERVGGKNKNRIADFKYKNEQENRKGKEKGALLL